MQSNPLNIPDSQWQILKYIWANEPLSARTLIDLVQLSYHWNESTIKTFLQRLVDGHYVYKDDSKRPFMYHSLISDQTAQQMRVEETFQDICSSKRARYIERLIQQTDISQSDCQSLIQLLTAKLATAPTDVACQCQMGQCDCHLSMDESKH